MTANEDKQEEEYNAYAARQNELIEFVKRVYLNDKSVIYKYGEKRPSDNKKPSKGSRWMTPKELAGSLIQRYKISIKEGDHE
jgi:hypothetical protein